MNLQKCGMIKAATIVTARIEDKQQTPQARGKHRIDELRFGNVKFNHQMQRSTYREESSSTPSTKLVEFPSHLLIFVRLMAVADQLLLYSNNRKLA